MVQTSALIVAFVALLVVPLAVISGKEGYPLVKTLMVQVKGQDVKGCYWCTWNDEKNREICEEIEWYGSSDIKASNHGQQISKSTLKKDCPQGNITKNADGSELPERYLRMAQQIILSLFLSAISLTGGYPTDNKGKCKLGIDDDCVYDINRTATRYSEIPCKEPLMCLFSEPPICYCNECHDLSLYLAKGSRREQELNISYSDKVVNGTHLGGTNATITCAKYGPHAMLTVFDRAGRAIVTSPSVVAMCDSRNHWVVLGRDATFVDCQI
ncbi:hypothetical protein Ddc_12920 [Ditylenchus destructor]|nr:hypothetical protein Ddc_12920 [Ditylenchus destructor]